MKRAAEVASILLASALMTGTSASGQQSKASAPAQELKAGDPAPDFSLKASDGKSYSLSQLRGKTVVLAWFPKAFTGG
jgi:peroxiredoxin